MSRESLKLKVDEMSTIDNTIPFPRRKDAVIDSIESILEDFSAGKMVVLVDDEDRENEGDLLIAAEHITAKDINFMAVHGRGLICLTLSEERCRQLRLSPMAKDNRSPYSTAFTVSIEAAKNVTTGISAADRAETVRVAVRPDATADDIVSPGHIFPIMAEPGGVLTRAGHTEAGSDLARLSGLEPACVLCEVLNLDGTMARLDDLAEFCGQHQIKIGTIADLIRYRLANEPTVHRASETIVQTDYGKMRAIAYVDEVRGDTHLALVQGNIDASVPSLLRVHVFTGLYEVIDAVSPEHPWSIRSALQRISTEGGPGAVVILNYRQGSWELVDLIQGSGAVAVETHSSSDMRIVGIGSQIAADIGFGKLRVLGSPLKMHGLSGFGLEVVEYVTQPE